MGSPDSEVHKEPPDICELSSGVSVVLGCHDWTKKWLGELGRQRTSLKTYVQTPVLLSGERRVPAWAS